MTLPTLPSIESLRNVSPRTGLVILLLVIFGLTTIFLTFLNTNNNSTSTKVQSSSSVNTAILRYDDNNLFTKIENSALAPEFLFELRDKTSQGAPKFAFQKTDYTISKSGSLFQSQSPFLQDSQYLIDDNQLIINQDPQSFVYNLTTGDTITMPNNIFSVVPIVDNIEGKVQFYYFLERKETKIIMSKSLDIDLSNPTKIVEFSSTDDILDIRILNNAPYIFGYKFGLNGNDTERNLTIYKVEKESIVPKLTIYGLQGIVFGDSKVFYTTLKVEPNDLGNYNTGIIDFKNVYNFSNSYFDFTREARLDNILGEIDAQRCNFDFTQDNVLCPVKKNKTSSTNASGIDEIISYNIPTSTISYPIPNIGVSVARIFFDNGGSTYFISQGTNNLFKLNGSK